METKASLILLWSFSYNRLLLTLAALPVAGLYLDLDLERLLDLDRLLESL